jgi:hypothetical protein
MTDLEREKLLQTVRDYSKNLTRESARKILIRAGIYDENGYFTEPYEILSLMFTPEGACTEEQKLQFDERLKKRNQTLVLEEEK